MASIRKTTGAVLVVALLLPAPAARAASETEIAFANVGITAAITLFRGWLEGTVRDRESALRVLGYGAVGGAGFYAGKRLAGDRQISAGVAVTWLSNSVVENVAVGEHPLAYLRYGVGPLDLRIATGFARTRRGSLLLDFNAYQTVAFANTLADGDDLGFRHGIFYTRSNSSLGLIAGTDFDIAGLAYGRHVVFAPGLGARDNDFVWRHEAVHVMQSIQMGAVSYEPYQNLFAKAPSEQFIRIGGVRIEGISLINDLATQDLAYENHWQEIEAYRIANGIDVPRQ